MENLLVQAINARFRNSTALKQANVRTAISDLEFVYNLREP